MTFRDADILARRLARRQRGGQRIAAGQRCRDLDRRRGRLAGIRLVGMIKNKEAAEACRVFAKVLDGELQLRDGEIIFPKK